MPTIDYTKIPLIVLHRGQHPYVNLALAHNRFYHHDSNIILLGDLSNALFCADQHALIDDYFAGARAFASVYHHMSINEHDYELFCFQRWFVLRDFCRQHQIESLVYLDSDLLSYTHIPRLMAQLAQQGVNLTVTEHRGPQVLFFSHRYVLEDLCDYLFHCYAKAARLKQLKQLYRQKYAMFPGGICDMVLLEQFSQQSHYHSYDLMQGVGSYRFDNVISIGDGFEHRHGLKVIKIVGHQTYAYHLQQQAWTKVATLHFQGNNKKRMLRFVNLSHIKLKLRWQLYLRFLCWYGQCGLRALKRKLRC